MTRAWRAGWIVLAVPACFHPSYDHPACGLKRECPDGLICSAQSICEVGPSDAASDTGDLQTDAATDGSSGTACYGPLGAWQVCLSSVPTGSVTLPSLLDTDASPICLAAQPSGWTPTQAPACFVVGESVTVGAASVTGTRPLVLLAQNEIVVNTLLDVASHHGGKPAPASPSNACQPFGRIPQGGGIGDGGGAGGSFMTRGGNGGVGDNGQRQNGQASPPEATAPIQLHGGCAGQPGGTSAVNNAGAGGGAVYLVSRGSIVVSGVINASGGGGSGDTKRTGGNGGGSGGMIVLYGTTITATTLVANGGGGSSGGSSTVLGADGDDPSTTLPLASVPGGQNGKAGDGGGGFPATANALDGAGGLSGAGGGGGGGGAGYIRSNQPLGSAIASPPADIVP
jgi:hypothetical protein